MLTDQANMQERREESGETGGNKGEMRLNGSKIGKGRGRRKREHARMGEDRSFVVVHFSLHGAAGRRGGVITVQHVQLQCSDEM